MRGGRGGKENEQNKKATSLFNLCLIKKDQQTINFLLHLFFSRWNKANGIHGSTVTSGKSGIESLSESYRSRNSLVKIEIYNSNKRKRLNSANQLPTPFPFLLLSQGKSICWITACRVLSLRARQYLILLISSLTPYTPYSCTILFYGIYCPLTFAVLLCIDAVELICAYSYPSFLTNSFCKGASAYFTITSI